MSVFFFFVRRESKKKLHLSLFLFLSSPLSNSPLPSLAHLYLHSLFPFGHCQNHPYCLFSTASKKCLQMMFVRLLAWAVEELPASAPCFCLTTDSSFSLF